ncbi:hypothetical protein [Mangrovihabitans endophyticus]|uniref:Uncharacterized protein n=1 Tax=Mangrovihabitans endophyticus TaxID=1751298 RepID=A0A8J3BZP4_9ACTN|nr:hypothetical protein [Mangrovihabitans endophyticus]GGK88561.1 hypothetical protein GCM10012284_23280 [Mangrovihabitans endophyticus]
MTNTPPPSDENPSRYPTAPPWAASLGTAPLGTTPLGAAPLGTAPPRAAAAPEPRAGAPLGDDAPRHGALLVPYPEEMDQAARPLPPRWWPIIPLTLCFGVLALITVRRRAAAARRERNGVAPYWTTWCLSMVAAVGLWTLIGVFGLPALAEQREAAAVAAVQSHIVSDGQLDAATGMRAIDATCTAAGEVPGETVRYRYDCMLTLEDGRTSELSVTADRDGMWEAFTG